MKKRLFLDTSIVLDLLGERDPFYDSIAKLATLADKKFLTIVVSPKSFATLNYFISEFESPQIAQ